MPNKSKGVFKAANAIDQGKLPARKDAVEYIEYLRGLADYLMKQNVEQEKYLRALGWKPAYESWIPPKSDAVWVTAKSEGK